MRDAGLSARQPSSLHGASRRARPLLFRQKNPTPLTPRPASSNKTDASRGRRGQTRYSHRACRFMRASTEWQWWDLPVPAQDVYVHAWDLCPHRVTMCFAISAHPMCPHQSPTRLAPHSRLSRLTTQPARTPIIAWHP